MSVTIPLVAVAAVVVFICCRFLGLRAWHLVVCVVLGFLLAATKYAPQIQAVLTWAAHWGQKP